MLLSKKLQKLSRAFDSRAKKDTTLPAATAHTVAEELLLLSRLASLMEQELAVHRMRESHAIGRAVLEEGATEALAQLVIDPEGKVIRPDFGGKRK